MDTPGTVKENPAMSPRAGERRVFARPFRPRPGERPAAARPFHWRPAAVTVALLVALVASVTAATAVGAVPLPLAETLWVIVVKSLRLPVELDPGQSSIVWNVRLPRVLVAGVVGFALAASGAAMQGLFRNPLAEPGIAGVSAGGSMGAVIAIFTGLQLVHPWAVPVAAFGGALLAAWLAYVLATRRGKTDTATLLLAGVALSSLFGAVISLMYHFVDDGVLRQIVYWLMGNLAGKRWEHLGAAVPFVTVGVVGLMLLSPELNILSGGEDDARSLGVSVERLKRRVLACVALATGTAISITGMIGFVGLIVPHALRLLIGPDHRWLVPTSGLAGASFLIVCDLVARVAFSPVELRTGIVTAIVGVPFFLYLLFSRREMVAWE